MADGTEKTEFALKALIILAGALVTVLLGFFVWLATAIVDIRVHVAGINTNVESLLKSRESQAAVQMQGNSRRLNDLESDKQGEQ